MLRERSVPGAQPTAYVCEHYVCKKPVTNPSELAAQLEEKPLNLTQVTKAAN